MRGKHLLKIMSPVLCSLFVANSFAGKTEKPKSPLRLVVRPSKRYLAMDAHFKKVVGTPYNASSKIDTDGDGLDDAAELVALTNPFDADTDGDGIPDAKDPAPLVAADARPLPGAHVRVVGGVPTFVIGGTPQPLTAFYDGGPVYLPVMEKMGECGIRLYCIIWRTPEPGDREGAYQDLDRDLAKLAVAVPDGYFIIRLLARESRWFARTFPRDLQTWSDGTTKWLRDSYGSFHLHSWASEAWTAATAGELVKVINHMRRSRFCGRFAGIQVCAGNTYEWWYYNYPGKSWDYGPAFQSAFRMRMREKYGTIDRLNRAWKTRLSGFGQIELPLPSEKRAYNQYRYFDPETQRRIVDYWLCFHRFLTDDVIYFSRVIKAASGGKLLAGFELQGACMTSVQNGNYLTKVLQRTPSVDFRAAPSMYLNRAPGGCAPLRIESASMVKAGKVWFNENDFRTHKTPAKNVHYNEGNDSARKSAAVLERLFGHLLATGGHGYWSENEFGNFADPLIHDMFRRTQRVSYTALELERKSAAEIALVYDEETALVRHGAYHRSHEMLRYSALPRVGAPYDYLELDDLLAMDRPPYKLYIFAGTGCLDRREREAIRVRIARNGRVLLWFGVPGLVNPDASPTTSEDYASKLVGMKLRWYGLKADAIRLTAEGKRTLSTTEGLVFDVTRLEIPGKTHRYDKYKKDTYKNYFEALDPDVKLGCFADGKCGFGLKRLDDCTSVYVSASNMSETVLRSLARLAGVHIYCESGDVLFADNRILVVHTRTSGRRQFTLRRKSFVWDLLADREAASETKAFELELPAFTTKIFYTGSRGEILSARARAKNRMETEAAENIRMRRAAAKANHTRKTKALVEKPLNPDGFVRDILFAGPFLEGREKFSSISSRSKRYRLAREWVFATDFLAGAGGEEKTVPADGIAACAGLRWRSCSNLGRYVRGTDVENLDAGIHAAYAAFYLFLKESTNIQVKTAFDDAGVVWVNRTRSDVLDGHRLDSRTFRVRGRAGWNRVMVKVFNRGGATGFALRIVGGDEKVPHGTRISLKPPK